MNEKAWAVQIYSPSCKPTWWIAHHVDSGRAIFSCRSAAWHFSRELRKHNMKTRTVSVLITKF